MSLVKPLKFSDVNLEYPGVELSIAGKLCQWESLPDGTFVSGAVKMRVSYEKIKNGIRKSVEIISSSELPTPDYCIIDRQTLPDPELKMRGYVASSSVPAMNLSDEEGGGVMPGCGYPLIGKKFFAGIEHQAAFNIVTKQTAKTSSYELRQHPVWENGRLLTASAVLVQADDPVEAFREYLEKIRVPRQKKILFSFCSFWSEPYCKNYEYIISHDNYKSFVSGFAKLDLHPDVYTLDAGWQERKSIFQVKSATGGEKGMVELRNFLKKKGSELSLWVSHNGPMGLSPEYLQSIGIAVGSGASSTYRGQGFGVLLDKKLEKLLTERFCELAAPPMNAVHFKMDWDNDCATSPEFKEKYPTRNHVREASVNVQNRIVKAIRKVNPQIILRHGWWPSPWQLQYTDHIFLADSGDCEYSSIPSLNQRDCSFTARDIQYFHHFRRDGGMIPLDALDNHDFPQAPRNPFMGDDGVWSNTVLWALMRGTSYQPWKIQPEALTDSQVDIIRNFMDYGRKNSDFICNGKTIMVGGNPREGEIYGFMHTLKKRNLLALRNPLPIPQKFSDFPENKNILQLYPCVENVSESTVFAPHEVKVFLLQEKSFPVVPHRFQYSSGMYRYPASVTVSKRIAPMVSEVYLVRDFELTDGMDQLIPGGKRYWFKMRSPYRMKNCALQIRITGKNADKANVKIYLARDSRATGNCFRLPYTEIFSGNPGRGENQNPTPEKHEWGRFLNVDVPCGGEGFFRLELDDRDLDVEIWASGYETPSRNADKKGMKLAPEMSIPPHPFGFPRTAKLEISGSEPEITETE